MGLSIVLMDINETILEFVDNDLVELEETISKNGLRTLSVDYIFEDFQKDKELFQLGNKLWIQGDKHLNDCLYVINTEVTENVFDEIEVKSFVNPSCIVMVLMPPWIFVLIAFGYGCPSTISGKQISMDN